MNRIGRSFLLTLVGLTQLTLPAAPAPALASCPAPTGDVYSTAVLADAPIAYYRLDESSGPTMCDASTAANHGIYSASGITYGIAGPLGGASDAAVAANGTAGVIGTSGSNSGITGNASFTLEGWFRSTGTTQNQALVAIGTGGNGHIAGLTIWPTAGGCAAHGSSIGLDEYLTSNCWDTTTVGINLFDQGWHHLAVTYNATTNQATGYVDAHDLGAQTPITPAFNLSASAVRVGNWIDTAVNQPFVGDADEVAVYATALSAARVLVHYSVGTPTTTTTTTTTSTSTVPTTTTTTTLLTMLPPAACPDAQAAAAIEAMVEAQCHCFTASTHGTFVRCAKHVAKDAATLPKSCKRAVANCAARSTCGKPGFVTCCRTTAKGKTTCSIKSGAARCRATKHGTACVGQRPSCCDACVSGGCTP